MLLIIDINAKIYTHTHTHTHTVLTVVLLGQDALHGACGELPYSHVGAVCVCVCVCVCKYEGTDDGGPPDGDGCLA